MAALPMQPSKISAEAIETVLVKGDLSSLKPAERVLYYQAVCESLGLNPLTQPFAYIQLNGKLTLYAKRDCTDQLRQINNISIRIAAREVAEGCYVVTAQAKRADGREDESLGAVPIDNLKGEARSNAMMKAETKAKRRVTLSICGLALLDESEVASVHGAVFVPPPSNVATMPQPAARIAEQIREDYEGEVTYEDAPDQPTLEEQLEYSIRAERQRRLDAFSALKSRYVSLGQPKTYAGMLNLHGVKHSTDFPDTPEGLERARACWTEMRCDVEQREARR